MLNDALLVKVKYIALSNRISSDVIDRQQLIKIGKGVIRAMLKELGGTIELTEGWARSVLKCMSGQKEEQRLVK